jgi:hypothetical protein
MHHQGLRCAIGALVLFSVIPAHCAGDDAVADPTSKRLLVLKNGRIVDGKISRSSSGFVVDKPKGSLLVPYEQVQFAASSRQNAYQKLKAAFPGRTTSNHIKLAQWCLTYQLHDEARSELREALEIDPDHDVSRRMLRRLEEVMNPYKPIHRDLPKPAPRTADGFQSPKVESLAGLSRKAARQFVGKVQPILMNKCGNARCHGRKSQNNFQLTRVRIGRSSSRIFSEKNLAAVLQYVDVDNPARSPLLVVPKGNHGRGGRTIFYGHRGSKQSNLLRKWVHLVAEERSKGRQRNRLNPQFAQAGVSDPKSKTLIFGRKRSNPAEIGQGRNARKPKNDLLESILRDERKDAFDPEDFNRAVHGKQFRRR